MTDPPSAAPEVVAPEVVAPEVVASGASAQEAQRLRLILEATPNAMVMVDQDGRIVLVNAQAEVLFGLGRSELLRMSVDELIPERSRAAHRGHRRHYLEEPAARPMGAGRDLHGVRGDGTEVPIEIGLNPIVIGEERFVLASIIDISERVAAQAAQESIGRDLLRRSILASMPSSVVAMDLDGLVMAANPATERLLGYTEAEVVGRPHHLLYADAADAALWPPEADGEEREVSYRHRDGSVVPVGEVITPVTDEGGVLTGFLAVGTDITRRLEARAEVDFLATHDALTGLPNRTQLSLHLVDAIERAQRRGERVVLMLLDVDHFKRVNDSLGHHAGDRLLLALAERLTSSAREGDLVARLGGDEFVLVLGGTGDLDALTERVHEFAAALPGSIAVDDRALLATASIGCAVYPDHADTPSHLLRNADIAMYRAKAAGRNAVRWFDPAMVSDHDEKLVLSTELQCALESAEEISVVYQPQVDLASGAVVGFEALARWRSPTLGDVSPERFIPVAEESGLIGRLGERVLRRACAGAVVLREALGRPLRMAVNVSPRQFGRSTWLQEVESALSDAGLEPSALELEITEGILMADDHDVHAVLHELAGIGTRIVVDDFGQGYSSLAYLTRFPVDKLKIDREFVRRIAATDADAAVIDAVLAMAQALRITVAAEGVETPEQERYLRERGCDEGQGFLYGEGLALDEARAAALVERLPPRG